MQLWNPAACHGNWSTILEIESIQRRFTRLPNDIGLLPYSKRLQIMNLTTLGERRIRGDLIETHKIITRKVDYAGNVFKVGRSGSNIVSKINTNVKNDICRLRQSFLPNRIKNYWNKLPAYVKFSGSVTSLR